MNGIIPAVVAYREKRITNDVKKPSAGGCDEETTVGSSTAEFTSSSSSSLPHKKEEQQPQHTEVISEKMLKHASSASERPSFQAFLMNEIGDEIKGNFDPTEIEPSPKDEPHFTNEQRRQRTTDWRTKFRQHFYQRKQEQELLRQAFESSRKTPNELIIISGESGSGKTRLAKTLQPLVKNDDDNVAAAGYFVLGKFDQLQRAAPYTAFVHAFTDFTTQVIHRGSGEMKRIQNAIEEAIGTDTSVLTGMIPALELILGRPEEHQGPKNTGGALQRFVFVFRMFIRSICSPDRPLVIVLDDMQFADLCSLDLFHSIAADSNIHGLVLVTTCDDSVKPDSYLASKLRDLEDRTDSKIFNLSLANYSQDDVDAVLGEVFSMDQEERTVLANLAYSQTGGNALYLIEYFRWLQDSEILEWDNTLGRWTFDEDEAKSVPWAQGCGSGDFFSGIMAELPSSHQEVLKVSACLGPSINEKLLDFVLGLENLPDILEDLRERGFLWKPSTASLYEFDHDIVQDAAYRLIPSADRELFHLEIGRRSWRKLTAEELDKYIFVVLSQMMIGRNLIKRDQEQIAVATLCLHAGQKAAKASTFRTAAVYLDFGLALMGEKRWRTDYDLMLTLHNASAEMEMCRANLDRMDAVLDEVFKHARVPKDMHQAYVSKIYALASQGRQHEAVDLGITVLDALGEPIRGNRCFRLDVSLESRAVSRLLRNKTNEQLLRLEEMRDHSKLRALQIINVMMLPVILERPDLAPLVILKSIKITLQHGLSVLASTSFAVYGIFCISSGAPVKEAKRFGDLAIFLLERYKAVEYLPRVYAAVYGCIHVWVAPVREPMEYLLEANRVGARTGDFEFAGLCAGLYCWNAMESGIPLDEILTHWEAFYGELTINKQDTMLQLAMPSIYSIRLYMGIANDESINFDYDQGIERAKSQGSHSTVVSIKFCRMIMNYMFGDFDSAFVHRVTLEDIMTMAPGLEQSSSFFFLGMLSVELSRQKKQARHNLRIAKTCLRRLRRWSRSCPQSFIDKVFLLEAELASLQRKREVAFEKYICAIGMAKNNKFTQLVGLAHERLGWHLRRLGDASAARDNWKAAQNWYKEWKANALVERMDLILQQNSK